MVNFNFRLFRSCRSKHPSTLPDHPVFHRQPHRSSFKSHVSSAFACGSKSGHLSDSDYFQWHEDDHWHVVAKIYDVESPRRKIYNSSVSGADTDTDTDDDTSLLPLPKLEKKKRRRGRRLKLKTGSSSSGDNSVLFTSIDERAEYENENFYGKGNNNNNNNNNNECLETETLISCSRSFSTDSSTDFNPQLETIRESARISVSDRYKLRRKRTTGKNGGRMMVFKEGKMKESFAMVKRTEDPYGEFRRSMMEMIMEKEIYEEIELERLLHCYLSLNSRVHHRLIVEAFAEIWETMFGDES